MTTDKLDILNCAAQVLTSQSGKTLETVLSEGLCLITGIAEIDCVSVFRDSADGRCLTRIFRWSKDGGASGVSDEQKNIPYTKPIPSGAECCAGLANELPYREMFRCCDLTSVLDIPVFENGRFWGVVFFERLKEPNFSDVETSALRLAGFILARAVILNDTRPSFAPKPGNRIIGIDWGKGLELFGDEEVLGQILRTYAADTRPLLDSIREVSAEKLPQYETTIKSLETSCGHIFASELECMAVVLERAANRKDMDLVARFNPDFLKAFYGFSDNIDKVFGRLKEAETAAA